MVEKIKKRDGQIADFNPEKIRIAAEKALNASGILGDKAYTASQRVSDKVVTKLEMMFNGISQPHVEQVQDLVEDALWALGYKETSKKYIIYRNEHKKLREADQSTQAVFDFARRLVNGYMGGDDWRSRENANSGSITFQGANARLAGEVWNNFALNEMYGRENPEIKALHESGAVHIHDLDFPVIAYCCGHSIEQLIKRGFGEVAERVQSSPAKHLETIVAQMVNYIGTMQGEFAGAQAFSSVDTFLAPFVRADNLSQEKVDQCMQMLIYGLNVPSRWGWQAPFSNLTFDLAIPDDLKNKKVEIGITEEYIEKKYQKKVNKLEEIAEMWATPEGRELVPQAISMFVSEVKNTEFQNQKQIAVYRVDPPLREEMKNVFETVNETRDSGWEVVELFLNAYSLPKESQREYLINGALSLYNKEKEGLKKILNSTYGDYQKEVDMINKGFLKIMMHGDKAERVFTFPIPTYNLTKNFDWDSEVSNLLFEVTGKYGVPYFQNYLGSELDPKDIRAMCCRLNLNLKELIKRPGNMWGPGDSTGSIGVVTINMNRIGYEAEGKEDKFYEILGHRMDVAAQSLEIKRKTIDKSMEIGFIPYTKSYLGHFNNHFSTIGLCGMNEACMNLLGKDISTEEGKEFTIKTLNFMKEKIEQYQNKFENIYNLEATPAESTSYRFAKRDKEIYPNIFVSGNGTPFLTNSTQLPVDLQTDLYSALKHQDEIQPLYTGGTIFHTYLGERIDRESAKNLVRKIAETTRLPYFSLTPVHSVCPEHKYLPGKKEKCTYTECDKTPEIIDRIVGYLRPVNAWNPGKQEEFKHRNRLNEKLNYVGV